MTYALGAAGCLVVLALCYLGLWRGWRGRQRRQAGIAPPPAPPDGLDLTEAIEGVYVATTTADDWLDRITVHGLGVRSRADVAVTPDGIAFVRTAAPSLFVPAADLLAVRTDRGLAGKVTVETSGLVVLTWTHDGHDLDTGFRPRHKTDIARLRDAVTELITHDASNGDTR